MKLTGLLVTSSCLAASAFGVHHSSSTTQSRLKSPSSSLAFSQQKVNNGASKSPLFRNPEITRGGAVPGWAAYNEALDKKPLLTKALTSLVGFALGDYLAQVFIAKGVFDMRRFLTLSSFGFLYHGPSGHYFYNFLDKQIPGTTSKVVALKVLIDQTLWCPIFMCVFFTYLGLANGDSAATIGNKIKTDLFSAMKGSWKVWPVVHAVNFKFISTKHRLIFINGVQIMFNMFLSIIGST